MPAPLLPLCVHDNASNIVLASNDLLKWESVCAHTLQFAITDGFKANAIKRLTGACTRLVSNGRLLLYYQTDLSPNFQMCMHRCRNII